MSKYTYTETEKQINRVLKHQRGELDNYEPMKRETLDDAISGSEELLKALGITPKAIVKTDEVIDRGELVVPSWEELCLKANSEIEQEVELEDLFTQEELEANSEAIKQINREFKQLYRLDKYDYMISALAGIVAGVVDVLLVGVPHSGLGGGDQHKPLSDYVREYFNKRFPEKEMIKLANSKGSKVPFDAQDNRNTKFTVEGLGSYYHRLLSLGHDPLLGFVVGIFDIMTGRMTTIDKLGRLNTQKMDVYEGRIEKNIFQAIAKEILHLKSDITTPMGLPAPLMGLFNLIQFGNIGEDEKTVAEIVQEMYHEGYDFIHFCSMSIPTMIAEVIARLGFAFKALKEGKSLKEAVPVATGKDEVKKYKLNSMLFIAHSATTLINSGKVYFKKDPLAINYPEWIAFTRYAYSQLKQEIIEKPALADKYVNGLTADELEDVFKDTNHLLNELSQEYTIVFNN